MKPVNVKPVHLLLGVELIAMLGLSWHLHEADHTCLIGGFWLAGITVAFVVTIAESEHRRGR